MLGSCKSGQAEICHWQKKTYWGCMKFGIPVFICLRQPCFFVNPHYIIAVMMGE
jgi:hypothetical protein